MGAHAHCQTGMPGMRENWIRPRVPSTLTLCQDGARAGPHPALGSHRPGLRSCRSPRRRRRKGSPRADPGGRRRPGYPAGRGAQAGSAGTRSRRHRRPAASPIGNSGCPAGAPIKSPARRASRRTERTIEVACPGSPTSSRSAVAPCSTRRSQTTAGDVACTSISLRLPPRRARQPRRIWAPDSQYTPDARATAIRRWPALRR